VKEIFADQMTTWLYFYERLLTISQRENDLISKRRKAKRQKSALMTASLSKYITATLSRSAGRQNLDRDLIT